MVKNTKRAYRKFIWAKQIKAQQSGFKPIWMPDFLYDFQAELVEWSLLSGRSALFEDCGLGKTPQQLVWSENVVRKTNKRVLIIAPLAVSFQTMKEAEKFHLKIRRTQDGIAHKGISITNYERLKSFSPKDFVGVVCDECFPPDTKINIFDLDNSLASKYIKDIKVGDLIYNAAGKDYVKAIKKRQIDRAIQVGINGQKIICSENHPFFTLHGWKPAKDLSSTDNIMETKTAVCLLRNNIPTGIYRPENAAFLRNILLGEMEDVPTGNRRQSPQFRSCCKERVFQTEVAAKWQSESKKGIKTNTQTVPDERSKISKENDRDENQKQNPKNMERQTGRQWKGNDKSPKSIISILERKLDSRICRIIRQKGSWLSNLLQGRFRKSKKKDSNRSRWSRPQEYQKEKKGQKKRKEIGYIRVDSIEILEQGHPELEKYRNEKGNIYFYDIEAAQHPSFSVNNLLVHNSSILKNFDGKTRKIITKFVQEIPYRLLCSATPAPNDYMELGTSSEALGYMKHNQMLAMFFSHSGETTSQWILKGHAKRRFWQWMSIWSRAIRKPSDLGYKDDKFILPELHIHKHYLESPHITNTLIPMPAITLNEQRAERRLTLKERCEKVKELQPENRAYLIWCHLNDEGDTCEKIIDDAVQVSGRDSDDSKESKLIDFCKGNIQTLITKPRIAGFGLNWQHCSDATFFPSHSYEQFYQCIRRCWRFGQKREVQLHLVASEREKLVVDNMIRKEKQVNEMYDGIVSEMSEFQYKKQIKDETKEKMRKASWM